MRFDTLALVPLTFAVSLRTTFAVSLRTTFAMPSTSSTPPAITQLEITSLIKAGPSENRVDVTFFADGYTITERHKFIKDAGRLAHAMVNGPYQTVKPLLNFWAVFTPSGQSGIGVNGPGNTPFGLYRLNSEYRMLLPGHEDVALATSDSLGTQSDLPVLLGNDPFYGGADGGCATVTASEANGPLVLAHELGHAFLNVGEEYDGGSFYEGPNYANSSTLAALPWSKWLSDPSRVDKNGDLFVEKASIALQAYAWAILNTSTAWQAEFQTTGNYSRYKLQFSLSGLPEEGDLKVTLDDEEVDWKPQRDIGNDRWFYNYPSDTRLKAGKHVLKFQLLNKDRQSAQLCSTEIEEYGDEDEFKLDEGYYGLYPTFDYQNKVSYRPTNNDCLMRDITSTKLCSICTEALWTTLLKRVSLIDNITESCDGSSKVLTLDLLPLADLRRRTVKSKESYSITWSKDGKALTEFANSPEVKIPGDSVGNYSVSVRFSTDEVKSDSDSLINKKEYKVTKGC